MALARIGSRTGRRVIERLRACALLADFEPGHTPSAAVFYEAHAIFEWTAHLFLRQVADARAGLELDPHLLAVLDCVDHFPVEDLDGVIGKRLQSLRGERGFSLQQRLPRDDCTVGFDWRIFR